MKDKIKELLGRKLTAKEQQCADWISRCDRETRDVFRRLLNEVHAAGLIRGLTGQAGGKILDERGWAPMESLTRRRQREERC